MMSTPAQHSKSRTRATALCAFFVLHLAACCPPAQVWPSDDLPHAFAPADMRVHPLTHMTRDRDGELMLVCHIELRDTWGDSVKGVGELELQLYGPGAEEGEVVHDASWSVSLYDLQRNMDLYDRATRTYRIQLIELPTWAEDFINEPMTRAQLVALLTTEDRQGNPAVIRAEHTLRP